MVELQPASKEIKSDCTDAITIRSKTVELSDITNQVLKLMILDNRHNATWDEAKHTDNGYDKHDKYDDKYYEYVDKHDDHNEYDKWFDSGYSDGSWGSD